MHKVKTPLAKIPAKRIAWGESADVFLLPKSRAKRRGRVLRVERRAWGNKQKLDSFAGERHFAIMQLAKKFFPENLINITHFEFKHAPRYYSTYCPAPKGLEREFAQIRHTIRDAHAKKVSTEKAKAEILKFDQKMQKMFPELIQTAHKLELAGFRVPHPELNFTIKNGKIVFYEVELRQLNFDILINDLSAEIIRRARTSKTNAKQLGIETITTALPFVSNRVNPETYLLSGEANDAIQHTLTVMLGQKIISTEDQQVRNILRTLTQGIPRKDLPAYIRTIKRILSTGK